MALEILMDENCEFKTKNSQEFTLNLIRKSHFVDTYPEILSETTGKSLEDVKDFKVTFEAIGIIQKSVNDVNQEIKNDLYRLPKVITLSISINSIGTYL